jgi:hypothetical protein
MKKLIALIKTQGKSKSEIVDELWSAIQKYFMVSNKVNGKEKC